MRRRFISESLRFYSKHSLSACCIPVLGIELERDRIACAFLAESGEGKTPQAPENSRKEIQECGHGCLEVVDQDRKVTDTGVIDRQWRKGCDT